MLLAAGLLSLFVGGIADIQRQCDDPNYLVMWQCIRSEAPSVPSPQPDLRARYMALGNVLAERVKAHRLTHAEAKATLTNELVRSTSESQHRGAQQSGPPNCYKTLFDTIRCN